MRLILASLSLFALCGAASRAASAYTAMQSLPPELAGTVAIIAGRDGTPEPERWHFLVHDPKAANGLREVVVAGGQKTANRTISQFAETLSDGDVINPDAMKVDSSQVAQIAREFGVVNKVSVSAMHFELRKSGPNAVPLWTVTCLDIGGAELGKVIVSAARGTVIMHPGFAQEPQVSPLLTAAPRSTPPPIAEDDGLQPTPTSTPTDEKPVKKSPPKKRATPPPATPVRQGFFQRVFGGSQPNSPQQKPQSPR